MSTYVYYGKKKRGKSSIVNKWTTRIDIDDIQDYNKEIHKNRLFDFANGRHFQPHIKLISQSFNCPDDEQVKLWIDIAKVHPDIVGARRSIQNALNDGAMSTNVANLVMEKLDQYYK